MSFTDPQSVTVSGTAVPLPRTSSGANTSAYTSADGAYTMTVNHAYGKRQRRFIRLAHNKLSADPLVPTQNTRSSMTVSVIFDVPALGYTVAEEKAIIDGFFAYLSATTGAQITKLLGGES